MKKRFTAGVLLATFTFLFLETEDVQALDLGAFAEKYSLTKRETEVLEALLNSDDSAKDLESGFVPAHFFLE